MKEEKLDISSTCWNKYKKLHTDKIVYLEKIYNIFNNLSKILSEFENNYKSLEIESFINPVENNKINETIKLINKSIISFINLNGRMTKNILKSFQEINKLIKNEKEKYDQVIQLAKNYKEVKKTMNNRKELFIHKMRIIEDSFKKGIIMKYEVNFDKKEMEDIIIIFNNYKDNVKEANNKRKCFIKNQKELLKLYQTVIFENEAELLQNINSNFFQVQKDQNDSSSLNMDKMKDKKKINKNEYNNEILSLYHSTEKPEEEIEVCYYNLKYKPYPTNQDSTPEDIIKVSQINDEIIKQMRKYLVDNFPECDLQIQEALVELPDVVNNFFEIKKELTEDKKKEIIKLIREDITIYPQILIILNRMRANSKLYKSKPHIEFLGIILKEILTVAEEKKDYSTAKNCILLSQTYYILDEKTNQKLFIFEQIKNNKWVNSTDFWRVFINNQIKYEFRRFESLYPEQKLNLLKNNPNINQKYIGRVKEILFSCLLSHTNNMMEFQIDKRITLKILDEFLNKYQYLDEDHIKSLYVIISPAQEEILKLRKEYQENNNLEKELIEDKKVEVKKKKKKEEKEEKEEKEKIEEKVEKEKIEEKENEKTIEKEEK